MPTLTLSGCAPVPLAHYLKALGVLRILANQLAGRTLAHWSNNTFILTTDTSATELLQFFEKQYAPAPIIVPWSGGDFFGVNRQPKKTKWKERPSSSQVIEAIMLTDMPRFAAYRQTLQQTFIAMDDSGVISKKVIEGNGTPQRVAKASLLQILRNRLPDEAVAWIDAAVVIEPRAPFFNTLLGGGGGSDGNSHFSDNFMQCLWMVLPDFSDQREKQVSAIGGVPFDSAAALSESLFATTAPGTRIDKLSPVLFDSTRVGGPNQTSGFEAKAGSNPWDFIFMLEGSLLFAGALGRKLDENRAPSARFPFLVNSSPVGLGSSYLGESSGREAWVPIWDRPTSLEEIMAIFGEGRIEKHGRMAKSGTDAFVALAQHGHSTGIAAFQRIGFFKGRIGGDNYFTAVDQGVFRSRRNQKVDLLKDVDVWLGKLRDTVQSDQCPKSVSSTVVQVEAQIAGVALNGSTDSMQSVLVSLGRAERALAKSLKWSIKNDVRPLCGLRHEWLKDANTNSAEFRLAASLAGTRAWFGSGKETLWLRQHLEPLEIVTTKDRSWAKWAEQPGNDVVWHDGDLTDALNDILARRIIRVEKSGVEGWPDWSPRYSRLENITAFIEGRTDDTLIADLLWGLSLIDWQAVEKKTQETTSESEFVPSSFYALLKLCFRPKDEDKTIPLVPAIHHRARSGDGLAASQLAARRLRGSGYPAFVEKLPVAATVARRTAAALLFPISPRDLSLLEQIIINQPKGQNT